MENKKIVFIITGIMFAFTITMILLFNNQNISNDNNETNNNDIITEEEKLIDSLIDESDFNEAHDYGYKTYYNLLYLESLIGTKNISLITKEFDEYFIDFSSSDEFVIDPNSINNNNTLTFDMSVNEIIYNISITFYNDSNKTIKETTINEQ